MPRTHFKTSSQAQSSDFASLRRDKLRWIKEANPRNPAKYGMTVVVPLDPLPLKARDLRPALNLIVGDPGL